MSSRQVTTLAREEYQRHQHKLALIWRSYLKDTCVRGYHVYHQEVWEAAVGEVFVNESLITLRIDTL